MSAVKDAADAIREALRLVDEVKRTAGRVSELTTEVREIDRRVSRLEGKWDAAMDFGMVSAARGSPRSLPKPKKGNDEN